MPVRRTTKNGKPAFQWGDEGKKYAYEQGNSKARERAKKKAAEQGAAIHASGGYQ